MNWLLSELLSSKAYCAPEILEEDKPLYFPKGSFIDIAMKASTRPELQEVYKLAEKHNSYIELKGQWFKARAFELVKN